MNAISTEPELREKPKGKSRSAWGLVPAMRLQTRLKRPAEFNG